MLIPQNKGISPPLINPLAIKPPLEGPKLNKPPGGLIELLRYVRSAYDVNLIAIKWRMYTMLIMLPKINRIKNSVSISMPF